MTDSKNDRNATSAMPTSSDLRVDPAHKGQAKAPSDSPLGDTAPLIDLTSTGEQGGLELKPLSNRPSNGPPVSKKSGNTNALRHGAHFYGLLPWESREDFQALLESLREDCKPHGALQEEVVLSLSQWTWKKRRVLQGSQISYYRSPVAKGLESGETTWEEIVQHQAQVPEQIETLISNQIKLVENLQRVSNRIGDHYYWTNTTEGKDIQLALAQMRSEVGALASNVREQAFEENKHLRTEVEKITNLFDHAYQPAEIEKQVKLLSMIDREIDKAVKRLIFLKTFESAEAANGNLKLGSPAQPLLESPPVIPNEAPNVEEKVKMNEGTPLRGTPTRPVALAAPEHRGKPKVD